MKLIDILKEIKTIFPLKLKWGKNGELYLTKYNDENLLEIQYDVEFSRARDLDTPEITVDEIDGIIITIHEPDFGGGGDPDEIDAEYDEHDRKVIQITGILKPYGAVVLNEEQWFIPHYNISNIQEIIDQDQ